MKPRTLLFHNYVLVQVVKQLPEKEAGESLNWSSDSLPCNVPQIVTMIGSIAVAHAVLSPKAVVELSLRDFSVKSLTLQ
jgi:hypothetical protein